MELSGAKKDADCEKVEVANGISMQLGCCNEYQPHSAKVQQFRCGMCKYLKHAPLSKAQVVTIRKAYA